MARETAAERKAREKAQQAQLEALERESYPELFLSVIAAALEENFEIKKIDVEKKTYAIYNRNVSDYSELYTVYMNYDDDVEAMYTLQDLDRAVSNHIERREFERVVAERRKAALAKLTPDERKLLNI